MQIDNIRFKIFVDRYRGVLLSYVLFTITLALFATYQKDFLTRFGPQSIFNQVITLCLATLGQTIIIITGGIDLSIGYLIIFLNCVAATIMKPCIDLVGSNLLGSILCIVVVLALGALCGFINATIIVKGRFQPIVATLAMGFIYFGLSRYVRPSPGGEVLPQFARFLTGRVLEYIPTAAVVLMLAFVLIWLPLKNSRYGQSMYAVGGNEYAAYVSGINIERTKLLVYTLAGISCALSALMLTAQTRSGDPTASNNFTNNSIAAAALGGASLAGGRGSYSGSIAGAFILSLIIGLLIFWKISSYYQNLIQGIILIVALSSDFIADAITRKRQKNLTKGYAKRMEA